MTLEQSMALLRKVLLNYPEKRAHGEAQLDRHIKDRRLLWKVRHQLPADSQHRAR